MRRVLAWGKAKGYVTTENPVGNQVLKHLLPKYKRLKDTHHAMLPVSEVPRFMADLHQDPSVSAKCLKFAILTAVCSGNVRFAEWVKIDVKRKMMSWAMIFDSPTKFAELCLHHKVGDAYSGAYERNQAMKSRKEMMRA